MKQTTQQTNLLQQNNSNLKQQSLKEESYIDPVKELVQNNDALPILAVIQHYQINQQIQPGKPLLNFLTNKFLPLDIIFKGRKIQIQKDISNKTPLHYAVEADDVKSAYWCIKNGNKSNKDSQGNSPIMIAIKFGHKRCFMLLLEHKLFDEEMAHIGAMYNRVWQLQVLTTLNLNYINLRDKQNRTPLDVAVENYAYQAAQYLITISPLQTKIGKLQNLTDSKAIIYRMKKAKLEQALFTKYLWPLLKIIFVVGSFYWITQYCNQTVNSRNFYLGTIITLLLMYIGMFLTNAFIKEVRNKSSVKIMNLLGAPDFPTIDQICSKCLHFQIPDEDHCDQCGCCVRRLHFHDFLCVNQSNENIWIMIEFIWLMLTWWVLSDLHLGYLIWQAEPIRGQVPFYFLIPRYIQMHYTTSNYQSIYMDLFLFFFFLHQLFLCLQVFGIMFMYRTYRQVNNTEKYPQLYRVVKLRDGTYRNKQIRVFENGFCKGLIKGSSNIIKFLIGRQIY